MILRSCCTSGSFSAASLAFSSSRTAETPDWIKRSNEDAQPLLKVFGDFGPEFAARTGVAGYDDKITQIPPDVNEKFRKAVAAVRDGLKAKLAAEKDPLVQQDLKIMIVMGAWGHSRITELVLGGTTRHLFQQSDLPLLVAH